MKNKRLTFLNEPIVPDYFDEHRAVMHIRLEYERPAANRSGEQTVSVPYAGISTGPDGTFIVCDVFNGTRDAFPDKACATLDEAKIYVESIFALEST